MVLAMLMESLFAIVDIFFVAKLGADVIAVVGLTEAVISLLIAVALGISIGITALVARRTGEGNYNAGATIAGQALWIGFALSIITSIGGILFAQDILQLAGASPAISEKHSGYTAILLGGSTTIFYIFFLNAVFRGCGDAKSCHAYSVDSKWLQYRTRSLFHFWTGPVSRNGGGRCSNCDYYRPHCRHRLSTLLFIQL